MKKQINKEEILRLRDAKYSVQDIADIMDCSTTFVSNVLIANGKRTHRKRANYTNTTELKKLADICRMYANKIEQKCDDEGLYEDIEKLVKASIQYGMELKSIEIGRNMEMS